MKVEKIWLELWQDRACEQNAGERDQEHGGTEGNSRRKAWWPLWSILSVNLFEEVLEPQRGCGERKKIASGSERRT